MPAHEGTVLRSIIQNLGNFTLVKCYAQPFMELHKRPKWLVQNEFSFLERGKVDRVKNWWNAF